MTQSRSKIVKSSLDLNSPCIPRMDIGIVYSSTHDSIIIKETGNHSGHLVAINSRLRPETGISGGVSKFLYLNQWRGIVES